MTTPLAAIDAQIAALQAQRQWLLARAEQPWPKRVTLVAVIQDDVTWHAGEQLGLEGEALRFFGQEDAFTIEYEVYADGRRVRLTCEGVPLPAPDVPS